jgi:hypothetical protein
LVIERGEGAGDPKVTELNELSPLAVEDVGLFDVSVDDPSLMGRAEGLEDLSDDRDRELERGPLTAPPMLRDRA